MPPPFLVKPPVPASTAPMVVETLLLMTGTPLLTASVSGSPVPVLNVQPCLAAFRSSKNRFPIVRAPSGVAVALAVNVSVLKPALAPKPLAATRFDQLTMAGHDPPAVLVQIDDAAGMRSRRWRALIWTLGLEPPGVSVNVCVVAEAVKLPIT